MTAFWPTSVAHVPVVQVKSDFPPLVAVTLPVAVAGVLTATVSFGRSGSFARSAAPQPQAIKSDAQERNFISTFHRRGEGS
jgi:hypothetical protein